MKLKYHIDGASSGNPGPAGIGFIVFDEAGAVIDLFGKPLGDATNNAAEYNALIYALKDAQRRNAEEADFFSDSELLAKQVNGEYSVRDENLKRMCDQALRILKLRKNWRVCQFSREENKLADKLAEISLKQPG